MGNQNRKNAVMGRQSTLREGEFEQVSPIAAPHGALRGEEAVAAADSRRRPMKVSASNGACSERKLANGARQPIEISELIGKELRSLYEDIVAQPVPDRFLDLLNQLETTTISGPSPKKAPGA
jgi:hypothetical protein